MIFFERKLSLCSANAFLFILFISNLTIAQTPTNGDFRTTMSGGWEKPDIWQVRSGGTWVSATSAPTATSNVYIQNNHVVTVTFSGDCRDLHVYAGGSVMLDCDGSVNIYGKLRRYTGTVVTGSTDGSFYSSQANGSSSAAIIGGTQNAAKGIFFKGTSRIIIQTGEWGVPGLIFPFVHIAMNAGNIATVLSPFYTNFLRITSGTLNMGTNSIYLPSGPAGNGTVTISAGATLQTANTGTTNTNCIVTDLTGNPPYNLYNYGTLRLMGATPQLRIENLTQYDGSTIEYGAAVAQAFLKNSYPSLADVSNYRNLVFSGSGNKTPAANFIVKEDLSIQGTAVLVMGARTATITGNWTSYGAAGLNEGTSMVTFDSTGAQNINTAGGESFYILRKNNTGTLTFNSNVAIAAGGNLNLSAGTINAETNSFTGTATSAFNMSGGTLRLAKLAVTLPEFSISTYNITGGTIVLDGSGIQTLRGARDYRNLTFSVSGTKGISSAINNISGTVTVANTVILDVANNTMGGTGTNLTMTGTSVYKTAGSSQVKPDAAGTYTLGTGTTIEFTNSLTGLESIRLTGASTVNYYYIVVSGSSVGTASLATGIRFQAGGRITVKNGGAFKHINTAGFSGGASTAISNTNNPSIVLETGSTIEYNGTEQTITNQVISTPSDANYQHLKLSNSGNKTAPSGILTIKGNLDKEGTVTFIHNSGTVVMNGTAAQGYTSGFPYMKFYNFTNKNTAGLSVNSEMSIERELAIGSSSKLNLQATGHVILLSSLSGTANIGSIPANATVSYTGNGKFTVHRYIATGPIPNHGKSWQFLSIATSGTQTINQAWQDTATAPNQNRYSGYGTQVTSDITPLPAGFDVYTVNGPSMKTYAASGNNWTGVANTATTPIYNQKGYMVFVRGDRSVTTFNGAANPTILRTGGQIRWPVSNPPPTINVAMDKFESIGNPYASAIDFSNDAGVVKSASIQKVFYVWDPKLGGSSGYGGYQTLVRGIGADNNYYITPGGGSYGSMGSVNNQIQSGQAFFVRASGAPGTVSFNENAKTSGSSTPFRTSLSSTVSTRINCQLKQLINTETILLDGLVAEFGTDLINGIDAMDAYKFKQTNESISINSYNTELAVERRRFPENNDSIFLKLTNLKVRQYQLCFTGINLSRWEMVPLLYDRYLDSHHPIDLNQGTTISFYVSQDAASYSPDRFAIVFKQRAADYPPAEYSYTDIRIR